ncbi:MAG: DUF2934 domain-containing protein [Nitrospira defluvii]|nr:DUF2934 domain-containing protein [Nitrospira defluvii]
MARQRAKTTLDTNGRQGRSLAPTNAPRQDNRDRQALSHKNGNGTATGDTRTRIEQLAYELYQRRGCLDGHDWEDWLEAERLALTQPARASQDGSDRLPTTTTLA